MIDDHRHDDHRHTEVAAELSLKRFILGTLRGHYGFKAAVAAGSGLASLVAVTVIGTVDAAQSQEPAAAAAAELDECPTPEEVEVGAVLPEECEPVPPPAPEQPAESTPEVGQLSQPDPAPASEPVPEGPEGEPEPEPEPEPTPEPPAPEAATPAPQPSPAPSSPSPGEPTVEPDADGSEPAAGQVGPAAGGRGEGRRRGDGTRRGDGRSDYRPGRAGGQDRDRDAREGGTEATETADPFAAATSLGPFGPVAAGYPGFGGQQIPPALIPLYRDCGARYGVPWRILAAINQVETAFGSNLNVSSAGAVGWMQFMPATWAAYGVDADGDGRRDPYDPQDAICAAGRYLRASGAAHDLPGALFAYNHADWYVDMVLALARSYAGVDALDPLPRAKRLERDFARDLARVSRQHEVDWAVVLAILRAQGKTGRAPAETAALGDLAEHVAARTRGGTARRVGIYVRSLFGDRDGFARKVAVLARYNRAVGLTGLVEGFHAVHDRLARRVLDSNRLEIYSGGRDDIASGRIDPRVLALLLYLAESYDGIDVTSLVTGHGYFARPGVPSAHAFGQAVDIAAIRGRPVLGNQQPGGVTDRLVRDILLVPKELRPAQVISLFDFGGPSFAAADHHDHVHVGY